MNLKKEILTRARSILSTNEAWTAGTYARSCNPITGADEEYSVTSPLSHTASCYCSLGAIAKAAVDVGAVDRDLMLDVLKKPDARDLAAVCDGAMIPLAIAFLKHMPHSSWMTNRNEWTVIWGCNDAIRGLYRGHRGEEDHALLMKVFDEAIASIDRGYEVHVLTKLSEVGWEKRFPTEFAAREELRRYVCVNCKEDENITAQSTMDDLLVTPCGLEFSYEVVVEH